MCLKNQIRIFIYTAALGLSGFSSAYAAVDWNWPQGQIPSNPGEIDRAMTFYQNGEIDSAIITLNGIKGAQDCRVRHILADIYRESGRFADAKRELQDIAGIESQFIANNTARPSWMDPLAIKLELGDTALQEGQAQEALSIYREVQQASPKLTQARTSIARVYESTGEIEQARNQYKSIIDSGIPLYTAEKSQIMERISQLEKHMEDEHARQRAEQKAAHGHVSNENGTHNAKQAAPQNQIHQLQTAQHENQAHGGPAAYAQPPYDLQNAYPAHLQAGSKWHTQTAAQRQASRIYEDQAQSAGTQKQGPLHWAMQEISQKKFDDAIVRLKLALKEAPQNAQVHYLLAIAYANTGKFSDAKSEYQEVLKHCQDSRLKTLAQGGLSKIQNKN